MRRGILTALAVLAVWPAAATAALESSDYRGLWAATFAGANVRIEIYQGSTGLEGKVLQSTGFGPCAPASGEVILNGIDTSGDVRRGNVFVARETSAGGCEKKPGAARFRIREGAQGDILRYCAINPFGPDPNFNPDNEIADSGGMNGIYRDGCTEIRREMTLAEMNQPALPASAYIRKFTRRRCLSVGPTSFYVHLADPMPRGVTFQRVASLRINGKRPEIFTGPTNGVIRFDHRTKRGGKYKISITILVYGNRTAKISRSRTLTCPK